MSISNKIFGVLNSIHFETELLEALDWDELKLNETIMKLNDYLSVTTKTDLDLLKVDLGYIFSENIADVIFKYIDSLSSDMSIINKQEADDET